MADENLREDLANTTDPDKGTTLVGVRQPLTSAAGRTQRDKNLENITPADFKFSADASDTQSIQRLIDRLSESDVYGKVVRLRSPSARAVTRSLLAAAAVGLPLSRPSHA